MEQEKLIVMWLMGTTILHTVYGVQLAHSASDLVYIHTQSN